MKIVEKTSIFPATRSVIFDKIQKLETLQYIASPYATFTPVNPETDYKWVPGSTSSYRFKLFGFIPFGTHTIHVIRFDEEKIETHEGNEYVPVWNHTIRMKQTDALHTQYTDHVEIDAGWKTFFVWLWANSFYAHRQRKWLRLLKDGK